MMKLVPLQEKTPESLLSFPSLSWVYDEMVAFYKPEKEISPELDNIGTLFSDFQPPKNGKNFFIYGILLRQHELT